MGQEGYKGKGLDSTGEGLGGMTGEGETKGGPDSTGEGVGGMTGEGERGQKKLKH